MRQKEYYARCCHAQKRQCSKLKNREICHDKLKSVSLHMLELL